MKIKEIILWASVSLLLAIGGTLAAAKWIHDAYYDDSYRLAVRSSAQDARAYARILNHIDNGDIDRARERLNIMLDYHLPTVAKGASETGLDQEFWYQEFIDQLRTIQPVRYRKLFQGNDDHNEFSYVETR